MYSTSAIILTVAVETLPGKRYNTTIFLINNPFHIERMIRIPSICTFSFIFNIEIDNFTKFDTVPFFLLLLIFTK